MFDPSYCVLLTHSLTDWLVAVFALLSLVLARLVFAFRWSDGCLVGGNTYYWGLEINYRVNIVSTDNRMWCEDRTEPVLTN